MKVSINTVSQLDKIGNSLICATDRDRLTPIYALSLGVQDTLPRLFHVQAPLFLQSPRGLALVIFSSVVSLIL